MAFFDGIRRLFGGGAGGNGRNGNPPADGGADDPCPQSAEMITCEEALTFIQEFLDGELEGVTREKVEAHFDVCGRCYPHLRMEESFRTALRRASDGQQAPGELKDRVRQLLSQASEE
jgi:anti-sigma factor (TIGR02949 family)